MYEGQGHRSKVKVTMSKKNIFRQITYCVWHVTWWLFPGKLGPSWRGGLFRFVHFVVLLLQKKISFFTIIIKKLWDSQSFYVNSLQGASLWVIGRQVCSLQRQVAFFLTGIDYFYQFCFPELSNLNRFALIVFYRIKKLNYFTSFCVSCCKIPKRLIKNNFWSPTPSPCP